MTSTSAWGSDRRAPFASRSPPPRPGRSTTAPRSATCGRSRRPPSPRDQALALVPFYAGARIGEIVALDIDDVARSARKAVLRILGKGERVRQVPIHPQLHNALNGWLTERADWPGANDNPALFLNQRGQRLSARGAHDIITAIARAAGLDDDTTAHIYADLWVMPIRPRAAFGRHGFRDMTSA